MLSESYHTFLLVLAEMERSTGLQHRVGDSPTLGPRELWELVEIHPIRFLGLSHDRKVVRCRIWIERNEADEIIHLHYQASCDSKTADLIAMKLAQLDDPGVHAQDRTPHGDMSPIPIELHAVP